MYNNYSSRFTTYNSSYGSGSGSSSIVRNYNVGYNKPIFNVNHPQGLQNLTNTCYMSAVLQVLFLILNQNDFPIKNTNQRITQAFFKLKKSHDRNDYKVFKKIVQEKIDIVRGQQEQDAHQFLISLLDELSNQNMKDLKGGNIKLSYIQKQSIQYNWKNFISEMQKIQNSKVIELFYGQALRQFICPQGHFKHTFERYQHLSLAIPDSKSSYYTQEFNIYQLLEHYLNDEKIEGLECESCKTKRTFNKKIVHYTIPKYLILHIARFKKSYYSHEKNCAYIQFDQILKLKEYKSQNQIKYNLLGIISHYGTLNRGHYIAQVKVQNIWYQLNDQKVSTTNIKQYGNSSKLVYLLIYERA